MGSRFSKSYVVTIPINTTTLTKIIDGLVVSGIIRLLQIDIPDGWDYSAGIQVSFADTRFPTEDTSGAEEVFSGNDTDIILHPDLRVFEAKIKISGINTSAIIARNCVVTLEIEQDDIQENKS